MNDMGVPAPGRVCVRVVVVTGGVGRASVPNS